jgi:hypothetical protein
MTGEEEGGNGKGNWRNVRPRGGAKELSEDQKLLMAMGMQTEVVGMAAQLHELMKAGIEQRVTLLQQTLQHQFRGVAGLAEEVGQRFGIRQQLDEASDMDSLRPNLSHNSSAATMLSALGGSRPPAGNSNTLLDSIAAVPHATARRPAPTPPSQPPQPTPLPSTSLMLNAIANNITK